MYQLIWGGRLWSVNVPVELDSTGACAYAQTFVVTSSHVRAMIAAMKAAFPGLSYDESRSDGGAVSGFGRFCLASPSHTYSQRPRTQSPVGEGNHGASRTGGGYTRPPQGPKATSSSPGGHRKLAVSQSQMLAKPAATPQRGGWQGSTSTTVVTSGGAPRK